ncbi:MAG: TRAP transporter large permease subunit [Proteobacteria bacterium]|nr:TRAP transporter large permease subunit [Pseudomonadota bacterium]MCH8322482.1 TRAP transporter large permease subunit [Pseudomonadota bacterium]
MIGPGLTILASLAVLLLARLWIGFALIAAGLITIFLFQDVPAIKLLAFEAWNSLNSPVLAALPLFILMGEILFASRFPKDLFDGLEPWTRSIPGRLYHINILGCSLFAAVSGSSAATTNTIGRMTLGELAARGYDRRLAIGSLCGAGTLGFLIPPSIILILYGVLAEVSILDLFLAGILPGVLLSLGFMAYLAVKTRLRPELLPEEDKTTVTAGERLRGLLKISPALLLILAILGSLYLGFASPSEAAVLGVAGALIISAVKRDLNWRNLKSALLEAVKTVSMIGLILLGALFLTRVMAYLEIPGAVAGGIAALGLAPVLLIPVLLIFYIALGMILDGLSVVVITLPIVLPLVVAAGFDPLWFGIFLVITVEMAQVTPPVGFNLFVVQNLTGEPIAMIARAAFPFFLIMAAFALLIAVFPGIVTFLPNIL